MLFNYDFSAKENSQNQLVSITSWCKRNRLILISFALCLSLIAVFNLIVGIIAGLLWFLASLFYTIWDEISSLEIDGGISGISDEDLIADLDGFYGSCND